MFLDVQIDSYFAHSLIFSRSRVRENRPFSRPFYFCALFLRENKRRAKIKGIKVVNFEKLTFRDIKKETLGLDGTTDLSPRGRINKIS